MDTLKEIFSGISTIFALVTSTSVTAILSVVGIVLFVLALYLATIANNAKSPSIAWSMVLLSLIGGMLFSAAGPGLALFWVARGPILSVSAGQAFENLRTNERVNWLIRLIPYDPDLQPDLAIGKLKQIGPSDQQYTFVASDDELSGYPVDQAVRMTGIPYSPDQRVSAIIFPVPHQPNNRTNALYPANARGVLQVIQNIEANSQNQIANSVFTGTDALRPEEATDLRNFNALNFWRWDNYFKFYPRYCQIAHDFECGVSYSAHKFLSGPNTDWHPLGLAQIGTQQDACDIPALDYCRVPDANSAENSWKAMKAALLRKFGSRVFLIQNLTIDSIKDRVLIDFGEPEKEYIPNMALRAGQ